MPLKSQGQTLYYQSLPPSQPFTLGTSTEITSKWMMMEIAPAQQSSEIAWPSALPRQKPIPSCLIRCL